MSDALLERLQSIARGNETGPVTVEEASQTLEQIERMKTDDTIRRMFKGRFDTVEIAQFLGKDESFVANRLAKLRDAGQH
jgi:hypothetical protein